MNAAKSNSGTETTGTAEQAISYRGRFAPTPSGPLHFGSLVAAASSYLDARANHGHWLVRIEDLDPPREQPGAADQILRTLEWLGLLWDETPLRQSSRHAAYAAAIDTLSKLGLLRHCSCTRSGLAGLAQNVARPQGEELYHPPDCLPGSDAHTLRFRVPDRDVPFTDRLIGTMRTNLSHTLGDFVLRRRDGLYAYQLAVVVDDAAQGISDIVRGADLLGNTPRQRLLQEALDLPEPRYLHVPLVLDAQGNKLSKSQGAARHASERPSDVAMAVLHFLRQRPPPELQANPIAEIWEWASRNWQPERFASITGSGADAAMTRF